MNQRTSITVLLDRSGSMEQVRTDTIGGFNAFVAEQKRVPGDCRLTLIQFDTESYDVLYTDRQMTHVPRMELSDFVPRSGTPLLDAMGRTIDNLGWRLAATPESERPGKVIMVIITDGLENESKLYSRGMVFERVRHQTEKYNWQFVYLGANQDAIAVGLDLGVAPASAMSWAANAVGTAGTYAAASKYVMRSRAAGSAAAFAANSFNADERALAQGQIFTTTVTTTAAPPAATTSTPASKP